VEKKGELKDAKNALSKDFDVLCLGEMFFFGFQNPELKSLWQWKIHQE